MSDFPGVILTPQKQQIVRDTLRRLQQLGPEIEKIKACGVDCSGYEALRDELLRRFTLLAQTFINEFSDVQG